MVIRIGTVIILLCCNMLMLNACNGNPGFHQGGQPPLYIIQNPVAVADNENNTIIVYQTNDGTTTNGFVQSLGLQGTLLCDGKGIKLPGLTNLLGEKNLAFLVVDNSGSVIISYLQNGDVVTKKLSGIGLPTILEDIWPLSPAGTTPEGFEMVFGGEGSLVAAWKSGEDSISVSKYDEEIQLIWSVPIETPRIDKFKIAIDTTGNVFVLWKDNPSYGEGSLYVQKVDNEGTVYWISKDSIPAILVESFAVSYLGFGSPIAPDNQGGAITVQSRGILNGNKKLVVDQEFYAQRIDEQGQLVWGEGISLLSSETRTGHMPHVITHGPDNVMIICTDTRHVYAQRLNVSGDTVWEKAISSGVEKQEAVCFNVTSDNEGGAVFVWNRTENGNGFLYAQHIDSEGNLLWGDGILVSTIRPYWAGTKSPANVVPDNAGGFIVTWVGGEDIFDHTTSWAQKISAVGKLLWGTTGIQLDS